MPKAIRYSRRKLIIAVLALLLAVGGIGAMRVWYDQNLRPVADSAAMEYFTVEPGSGAHQIAVDLKEAGLIRNVRAFETYLTTNNSREKLKAGTYLLSASMSTRDIADKLARGEVAKNLLTILPGKRLDEVKQAFRKAGYSRAETEAAFSPGNYAGHPALASLPRGATLEGYLYPDSFQKDSHTPARAIVRQSLDEMQRYMTSDVLKGFAARKLSVFQGITLASIILRETDNPKDMPVVAQVLLTRLARDMPLQADATAFYASDVAGRAHSLSIQSPYNTYLHKGLTPGPISNVTVGALKAAANPARTDYLYYVTGDDEKTRFSHTLEQHQANVLKYCQKRCR